ncbi:5341_t:CDS:2 [Dentiscutata heterogama]|uniref:5341_t:CDS:1 n=1 Tax=Dentiscutata heterogama TaxID=1316150 RepID=A0ACA9KVD5_9GLOM|nr:5341_t:CDS:2 [Dentiscutata heterogama]
MYSSHNKRKRDTHSVLSAPQLKRESVTLFLPKKSRFILMVPALPLAAVESLQQLVLALPLAAMEPNTTIGPCTAPRSRGSKTTSGPCTATCSRRARYTTGPCTANAAVEPDTTKETTLLT